VAAGHRRVKRAARVAARGGSAGRAEEAARRKQWAAAPCPFAL